MSGSGEKWRYQRRRIVHHYLARPSLPPFFCAMTDCLTEWESIERERELVI